MVNPTKTAILRILGDLFFAIVWDSPAIGLIWDYFGDNVDELSIYGAFHIFFWGTPKWLVFFGENPGIKWMIGWGTPIYGNHNIEYEIS